MSLTPDDLDQIRLLMREEVESIVGPRFDGVYGKLETLENDVKEIYEMLKPLNSVLGSKVDDHEVRIATLGSQAA